MVDDPELRIKVADAASACIRNESFHQTGSGSLNIVEEKSKSFFRYWRLGKQKDYANGLGILHAHIVLAAHAEGLGSCILGWFNEPQCELLSIPIKKSLARYYNRLQCSAS